MLTPMRLPILQLVVTCLQAAEDELEAAAKKLRDEETKVAKLRESIETKYRPAAEAEATKLADELAAIDVDHDAQEAIAGRREATDPAKSSKTWKAEVAAAEKKFAEESKRYNKSPEQVLALTEDANQAKVSPTSIRLPLSSSMTSQLALIAPSRLAMHVP